MTRQLAIALLGAWAEICTQIRKTKGAIDLKRTILAALAALAISDAFAAFNPLQPAEVEYLQEKFNGVWNVYSSDSTLTVTIEHEGRYFTLMLDDTEAQDAKVIDVDTERGIVTVSFTNTDGLIDDLTLMLDGDGDLWFSLDGERFPLQYTRRITQRDRDRIDCMTGPVAYRNLEGGDLNCEQYGY